MEELILDQQTMDELYPPSSDFYEAFRARTPVEKAALIWRMPEDAVICTDTKALD